MPTELIDVKRFHQPLMEAGLVPPNCKLWEISVGVSGALSIRYEVYLTADQLVQLGAIFQAVGAKHRPEDVTASRTEAESDA
jgi:hypothetical protein